MNFGRSPVDRLQHVPCNCLSWSFNKQDAFTPPADTNVGIMPFGKFEITKHQKTLSLLYFDAHQRPIRVSDQLSLLFY